MKFRTFSLLQQETLFFYILLTPRYSSVFFITSLLVDVKWFHGVVLNCISFIDNNIEHLFMCLFAYISSLMKCLLKSFAIKKIEFVLFILSLESNIF